MNYYFKLVSVIFTLLIFSGKLQSTEKSEGSISCESPTRFAIFGFGTIQICMLESSPDAISINKNMVMTKTWIKEDVLFSTGNIEFLEGWEKSELSKFLVENKNSPSKIESILYSEFSERFSNNEASFRFYDEDEYHLRLSGLAGWDGYFIEAVVIFNTYQNSANLVQFVYKGEQSRQLIGSKGSGSEVSPQINQVNQVNQVNQ